MRLSEMFPAERRSVQLYGLVMLSVVLCGCSKSRGDRVEVFPVEGQLQFSGQPLEHALVVFHPVNSTDPRILPARGFTDREGRFRLTTYDANDGAAPGQYAVTVEYYRAVANGDSFEPGPNILPREYGDPYATSVRLEVAAAANQLAPINLGVR